MRPAHFPSRMPHTKTTTTQWQSCLKPLIIWHNLSQLVILQLTDLRMFVKLGKSQMMDWRRTSQKYSHDASASRAWGAPTRLDAQPFSYILSESIRSRVVLKHNERRNIRGENHRHDSSQSAMEIIGWQNNSHLQTLRKVNPVFSKCLWPYDSYRLFVSSRSERIRRCVKTKARLVRSGWMAELKVNAHMVFLVGELPQTKLNTDRKKLCVTENKNTR